MPGMPVQTCVKMVSEAAKQCAAPMSTPTPAPNFDALAASLAAQANAIASQSSWLTFGGVLLALVAVIAGAACSWVRLARYPFCIFLAEIHEGCEAAPSTARAKRPLRNCVYGVT